MKKVLIIGAASAIARETAYHFAERGDKLFLSDINEGRLEATKNDINARHKTEIHTMPLDVLDFEKHEEFFNAAVEKMGGLDIVFIAHGTLADQMETQQDNMKTIREININSTSVMSLCTIAANYFEPLKKGSIAVISSVAGDRGRQSNYIYGSAKGAVTIFLQGLRNRLAKSNVQVTTIKPGMVDTPMTAHMPKGPLFAPAKAVGQGIFNAIANEKDVAYVPGYWKLVMHIIRHIPESIFKKLSL